MDVEKAESVSTTHNPTDKNQYLHGSLIFVFEYKTDVTPVAASVDDERVKRLLIEYHGRGITDRKVINQLRGNF